MKQATLLLFLGAFLLSLHLCFALVPMMRCDAGGKVKMSQTKLDQPIRKFVWLNDSNGNVEAVFVLTRGRTVWRSTDEGKTFERLDSRLPPPIDDIIITSNYKKIYFLQFRGKLWTTEDQGENFKLATSDLMIQSVRAHPTQANWALAQVMSPSCVPVPRAGCSLDLYLTQDFGASWERKVSFVAEEQYDWGGAGKDGVPVGNVFYINFPQATADSNQFTLAGNRFNQVFQRTSDLFKTFDSPRPHTVAFKYLARTVITAEITSANDDSLLALYGSHDDGDTFSKCLFPTSLTEKSYHVADLSEGTAIVSVDHAGGDSWSTTYISDSLINKFSTISNYTRRSSTGKTDIRRVQSLQGIYVTNRFIVENENDPVNEDTPLTSAITFDKGGLWQPLAAPAKDLSGAPPCSGCNINLVPFSQTRRGNKALYSREDTPGLLLATGSVGPWLDDSRDKVNTYISRDGGMSWSQLTNGEYTYEVADYGSLIMLTKSTEATYSLMYTWDQGLSMTECAFTFSTSPLEVKEIYNSPSGQDLSFIIYGTSGRDNYLVHVDFTNSDTRLCDAQTDYEKWSPSDAHNDQCLMGQKITYTRRKQDSKCYNNVNNAKPGPSVSLCACDREDFQCDYCFEPDKNSPGRCILDADCPTDPLAKPTQCLGTWNKTQGYRLVPGNKCRVSSSNYNNYAAVVTKCTGGGDGGDGGGDGGSGGLSGGAIFGILVLVFFVLAGVLAVVGVVLYKVNPEFRDFVDKHKPSLPAFSMPSKDYAGSGSHEYSRLNSSEPQSLLDDLEGDDNGGLDDDDLLDEAPEIDDKSLSNFTNQNAKKDKNDGGDADSLI